MAKDLSGSTSQTGQMLRAQIEKENNLKFTIAKIALVVLAVAITVKSGISIYGHYTEVQRLSLQIEQEQASFDVLKAEAEAWHKENDRAITDRDEESGLVVSEITLPSARNAGNEVADLQDRLYANGLLTVEDENRLKELTYGTYGGARAWFTGDGSKVLDPAQSSLDWRFDTWYDATPDSFGIVPTQYDCVWTCWNTAPSGTEYMVAAMFGSYLSEKDCFNTYALYISNFGEMLAKNGSIEAVDNDTDIDPDFQQMIDDIADGLAESEGEGTGASEGDASEETGGTPIIPDDDDTGGGTSGWDVDYGNGNEGNAGGTVDGQPDPADQGGATHGA